MRRLSMFAVLLVAVLTLACCGSSDESGHAAGTTALSASASSPAASDSYATPVDVVRRDLLTANTLHYVFELTKDDGAIVAREVADVRLNPLGVVLQRAVGAAASLDIVATDHDAWTRSGQGCWAHSQTEQQYDSPAVVMAAMYSNFLDESGHTLKVSAPVSRVLSELGEAAQPFDVPTSGSQGLVELRTTVDDSGRVTRWETTVAEVIAALDKVGAQPDKGLRNLGATFSTTFTRIGEPVDIEPPKDDELCAGDSSAS